jgi:hypothetical protein
MNLIIELPDELGAALKAGYGRIIFRVNVRVYNAGRRPGVIGGRSPLTI